MDCKMDKEYWTNFDLLDAVKTICAQKGLAYTKSNSSVAEELLFQIGELSIHSSQSEEDKIRIDNFRCKYIRVVNQFKTWRNNFSGPAAQQYGMQEFCKLKQKNNSNDNEEVVSSQGSSSNASQHVDQETEKESKRTKSLTELTLNSTQMRSRLKPVINYVKEYASENNIDVTSLLGLMIYNINYSAKGEGRKAKAAIGKSLFLDKMPESEMSTNKALSLLTNYKFGKRQYTNLRLDLKPYLLLPTYNNVNSCKDSLLPAIDILPQPLVGIKYLYKDALHSHFSRFFELHPEFKSTNYKVTIKDGCDGSGRHSIYNQQGNVQVHNIISYMFVVIDIYERKENPSDSSQSQYSLIYSDPLPNSPEACRPVSLIMGKENIETLREFILVIQREMSNIEEDGLCVKIGSRAINIKVKFKSCMNDGKMKNLLTGRGGAYCVVSSCSREDGNISQKYVDGFPMKGVSIPELWDMFYSVEKHGKVPKHIPTKDRLGMTNPPLLSSNNVDYIPVLHVMLRTFDWALKVVYHRRAGLSTWTEYAKDSEVLKVAKKKVQACLQEKTSIRVDQPDPTGAGGNTNTGNSFRRIFWNKVNRDILAECAPEKDQLSLKLIFKYLAIILRLVSSDHKIKVDKLDIICKDTAKLILDDFKGEIMIPNTLHVLLAHACALIEANDGHGLKKLSEEPLESNNKFVRNFREHLARKTNPVENLTDVSARLWVKSDPIVRTLKRAYYCTLCEKVGEHTVRSPQCPQKILMSPRQSDDAFFNQFIIT